MFTLLFLTAHVCRAERKEFSNDPIQEMKKISSSFQTNMTNIESDIARLKKEADGIGQVQPFCSCAALVYGNIVRNCAH
jgi:hypothetical protein